MRATMITYARVHNLGNYENERIEITIQLDEGEKSNEAMRLAKLFVNRQLNPNKTETEDDRTALELFAGEVEETT